MTGGENGATPQPMDLVEKLREAVRPLGMEVHGFNIRGETINLTLSSPSKYPSWLEEAFPGCFPRRSE